MNNEDNTNYGLDVNLICEFFMGMDRQGPGSPDMTVKALSFIEGLDERSRIADLGCGTGGQTMTLAEACPAQITAIDNYPGFIDKLNHEVQAKGLQARVNGLVGTMEEPPFEPGSLDLIWCEGAIYNIGFEPVEVVNCSNVAGQIVEFHYIKIHQSESPNSFLYKGNGNPGTEASEADDENAAILECVNLKYAVRAGIQFFSGRDDIGLF